MSFPDGSEVREREGCCFEPLSLLESLSLSTITSVSVSSSTSGFIHCGFFGFRVRRGLGNFFIRPSIDGSRSTRGRRSLVCLVTQCFSQTFTPCSVIRDGSRRI